MGGAEPVWGIYYLLFPRLTNPETQIPPCLQPRDRTRPWGGVGLCDVFIQGYRLVIVGVGYILYYTGGDLPMGFPPWEVIYVLFPPTP